MSAAPPDTKLEAKALSFHDLFIKELDDALPGWEAAFAHDLTRQDCMKRLFAGCPPEETLKWFKGQTSLRLWSVGKAFAKAEAAFFAMPNDDLGPATCDK